jgi:hypothetical protein
MRIQATLLALAGASMALPNSPAAVGSEYISIGQAGMVLDRNVDTKIESFSVSLMPSAVQCIAANFTLPSPEFKCGDSSYAFALQKVPEYYSRYNIQISHFVEDGYANPNENK